MYGYSGDGLAFSISPDLDMSNHSYGKTFGLAAEDATNLANSSDFHLFAVKFDNFENPDLSDPSSSHIGININGLASVATFDSQDSQSDLHLYNNYTIFVWVEYLAPLSLTLVYIATNSSKRPSQPCVNVTYNLSLLFDPLQKVVYAAILASSGAFTQGTALFSWFTSEDVSPHAARGIKYFLLVIVVVVVVLLAIFGAVLLLFRRLRENQFPFLTDLTDSTDIVPRFSYRELAEATQNFNLKVGDGSYSSVYRGVLSTGCKVAVKRLTQELTLDSQFIAEIHLVSQIRHRNLLQLRGWSYEKGKHALLVYPYMPYGSLDRWLFGDEWSVERRTFGLDGAKRFRVLMGVAAGLNHLHVGCQEYPVLHRDVKAANVLLTESCEALLGDFGQARLIKNNQVAATIAGTTGYMAPEVLKGQAGKEADVYSFGILTLEVACGRRVIEKSLPLEEQFLLDWVWELQGNGKLMDALDMCVATEPAYSKQQRSQGGHRTDDSIAEVSLMAQTLDDGLGQTARDGDCPWERKWRCALHLALLCCNPDPKDRFTMEQVGHYLRESIILPLPPSKPPHWPSKPPRRSPEA